MGVKQATHSIIWVNPALNFHQGCSCISYFGPMQWGMFMCHTVPRSVKK